MSRDLRSDHEPSSADIASMGLREYMVHAGVQDPIHWRPFTDAVEHAVLRGQKLRCVIEGPRQHGKTTVAEHAVAWALHRVPTLPACYATYGQDYSGKRSRQIRSLYVRTGGKLSPDHNTIQEWRNDRDGGLLATSPGGVLTGHTVKFGMLDDLIKNRAESEVAANRELIDDWIKADLLGCASPNSALFLVASRYHEDDPSGRRITAGWDRIRLPAICDDPEHDPLGRALGAPLCPWGPDPNEPRDLAFLLDKQREVGDYDWESLYMCRPRPRGGALFRNATLTDRVPRILRYVIGADLAYSATGDWIAFVLLGLGEDGKVYVLRVWRRRKSIVEVLAEAEAEIETHGQDAPIASYVSGPEKGVVQMLHMIKSKIRVRMMNARWAKLYRAERTATRWNRGDIVVLRDQPWTDDFVREVCDFTGLEDGRDDQTDALVSAHDWMFSRVGDSAPRTMRGPYAT